MHTAKYAECVNTGTVAIQASLRAIGILPGDEVIVPACTWEGTVGPVLLVNAVPIFVDIDPDTYCLDAKLIAKAITPLRLRRFFLFILECSSPIWTRFCASPQNTS